MTPADYIDAHEADLIQLIRRLVRLPTVNPPGDHYDAITALLVAELSRAGLAARRLLVPDAFAKKHLPPEQRHLPRWNVLGRLDAPMIPVRARSHGAGRVSRSSAAGGDGGAATQPKTLHFNAPYDVVPVYGKWRHGSPF